jgi:hypothetical protein
MAAVAIALPVPPVREDPVHLVPGDDLALHLVHELEVIRTERARDPEIRVGPMPIGLAVARHRNPVRVGGAHLVAHGMRIGARDDMHPQRAAARDERAERIALAQPCAAMVQGHLSRVVRDDAAGAQACGVGADAAEVVEPELRIEAARIVLDERELDPAHRPIEPAGQRVARPHRCRRALRRIRRRTKRGERASAAGQCQEVTAGEIGGHGYVLFVFFFFFFSLAAAMAAFSRILNFTIF